ncbi:Pantoate-beta-alanine ligase [Mycotypha africana]|uniref:Pantoate-beta-alanine ligase n=1 Tax=Mycotypha africana TaxID=64632 RepID=UPI0023000950|nr:Pantoate-beta-alanine ligase [Mycotypha africana]KAI8970080.1 Pantoate-beta-alanine ligase [Mycotypha africana]
MNSIKIPSGIKVFNKIADFRQWRRSILMDNKTLGYVPTMGALHQGHLALVSSAKKQCDHVALSIFVNPAQFAPTEDLHTYPRTLQEDLDKLSGLGEGVASAVLVPQVEEMYPAGINLDVSKQKGTFVEVLGLSHQLEGITRPNFFRGVATVVSKFINIVQPEHIYFGQKDIQQCFVIRDMIRDLHFPTQMHICPTVRDSNGLALSSRNAYLIPSQKKYALALSQSLRHMEKLYKAGENNATELVKTGTDIIEKAKKEVEQLNEGWSMRIDYISINSGNGLKELKDNIPREDGCVISMAVFVGTTRLIDNICLDVKELEQ